MHWNPTIGEWVEDYTDPGSGDTFPSTTAQAQWGSTGVPGVAATEFVQAEPTGGGGGELPAGFASWADYEAWRAAFAREHGGLTPEEFYRGSGSTDAERLAAANEDRQAGNAWAAQHGNPTSWGGSAATRAGAAKAA